MKINISSAALLTTAIAHFFHGRNTMAAAATSSSSFPDFTCNILQYPGNGCNEADISLMETTVAELFIDELPSGSISQIVFNDFLASQQDVFDVSLSGVLSYSCSSSLLSFLGLCLPGGRDRRNLARNVCAQPRYCTRNPNVCICAGCPKPTRRRLRHFSHVLSSSRHVETSPERQLQSIDVREMAERGTFMIQNMASLNNKCNPRELGFRCDWA